MLSIVETRLIFLTQMRILLCLLLLCCGLESFAQEEAYDEPTANAKDKYLNNTITTREFDQAKWKKAIEGIDYSGEKPDEVDVDEDDEGEGVGEARETREREYNRSSPADKAFLSAFFKILLVVLAIVAIALLAYFIIGGSIGRPKSKHFEAGDGKIDLQQVEENIHESDLDSFIRKALSESDYPLAVRLYYLAAIKEMSLSKKVKWKRDKTNRDYQNELSGSPLFQPFRQATRIFERVWYGNGQLDRPGFEQLQPAFLSLIELAKNESAA